MLDGGVTRVKNFNNVKNKRLKWTSSHIAHSYNGISPRVWFRWQKKNGIVEMSKMLGGVRRPMAAEKRIFHRFDNKTGRVKARRWKNRDHSFFSGSNNSGWNMCICSRRVEEIEKKTMLKLATHRTSETKSIWTQFYRHIYCCSFSVSSFTSLSISFYPHFSLWFCMSCSALCSRFTTFFFLLIQRGFISPHIVGWASRRGDEPFKYDLNRHDDDASCKNRCFEDDIE